VRRHKSPLRRDGITLHRHKSLLLSIKTKYFALPALAAAAIGDPKDIAVLNEALRQIASYLQASRSLPARTGSGPVSSSVSLFLMT